MTLRSMLIVAACTAAPALGQTQVLQSTRIANEACGCEDALSSPPPGFDRATSSDAAAGSTPAGARTWKWMLPSPRWPKATTLVPGQSASIRAEAAVMKPGMAATGTEMSC